jgi:hypothetical protein
MISFHGSSYLIYVSGRNTPHSHPFPEVAVVETANSDQHLICRNTGARAGCNKIAHGSFAHGFGFVPEGPDCAGRRGSFIQCRTDHGGQAMKSGRKIPLSLSASLVGFVGLCTLAPVLAQNAPPSYIASPDVYKLVAENDELRVITATWKPGQRDAWHSHAGGLAYRLTDCKSRFYTPDGKYRDVSGEAGEVRFNSVVASHSFENVGTTECRVLHVERK